MDRKNGVSIVVAIVAANLIKLGENIGTITLSFPGKKDVVIGFALVDEKENVVEVKEGDILIGKSNEGPVTGLRNMLLFSVCTPPLVKVFVKIFTEKVYGKSFSYEALLDNSELVVIFNGY
jgi:hypothetical protein